MLIALKKSVKEFRKKVRERSFEQKYPFEKKEEHIKAFIAFKKIRERIFGRKSAKEYSKENPQKNIQRKIRERIFERKYPCEKKWKGIKAFIAFKEIRKMIFERKV